MVNAYEVKAAMVCMQCDPYLFASEMSFYDGALYKSLHLYLFTFTFITLITFTFTAGCENRESN